MSSVVVYYCVDCDNVITDVNGICPKCGVDYKPGKEKDIRV